MALASDAAAVEKELSRALDDIITRQVEPQVRQVVVNGVSHLASISPVFTGWFRRNHRVSLTGDVALDPSPEQAADAGPGDLVVPISENENQARQEMAGWKLGVEVIIANAVPYALLLEEEGSPTIPQGSFFHQTAIFIRTNLDPSS